FHGSLPRGEEIMSRRGVNRNRLFLPLRRREELGMPHTTLRDWIEHESLPFTLDSEGSFNTAVDRMMASLSGVELLGITEPLHGGEEFLILRNRFFERLVEAHGFRSIAIESSLPKSRVANEYVQGRGPVSFEEVCETGLSHGFGKLEANHDLLQW